MRNLLMLMSLAIFSLSFCPFLAQTFTNGVSLLPSEYHSGGCVGFTDMDGDGFDDIIVLDESEMLHVLYQGPDGSFSDVDYGSVSGSTSGVCVLPISTMTDTKTFSLAGRMMAFTFSI